MILYDTQHWWTKNCHKWMGQWLLWRLDVFKDILRVSWWFMHHHYSQDRTLIVLRNHVVSLIFLVPAVAVYEADFQNIVLFKFTIPLLLFICTSLCFVSYILFKIQKWCEALVKFSEIYNFNFCIFFLMFLAYDVDVLLFKKIPNA